MTAKAPQPTIGGAPVAAGQSWTEMLGGVELPEHEVVRIKSFLNGMGDDDLVFAPWVGPVGQALNADESQRLIIVGRDGIGRELRSRRGASEVATPEEMLEDVSSITLCHSTDLRWVVIDVREDENPYLMSRREDFVQVVELLKRRDKGELASIWRGLEPISAERWCAISADDYLFQPGQVEEVLEHTCDFLNGPQASTLRRWGLPPRRGVLLHGPPGNGKTVLTRLAIAQALREGINVVLLSVDVLSGRDHYLARRSVQGVGEHLRFALRRSPVLVVIDDIDIHCGTRAPGDTDGETDRRRQFLAELLEFLDGVESSDGYALLATANHIDAMDRALTRPGRFDRKLAVPPPESAQRLAMLERETATLDGGHPTAGAAADLLDGASYAALAEVARRYKLAVVDKHGDIAVDQELFDRKAAESAEELGLRRAVPASTAG